MVTTIASKVGLLAYVMKVLLSEFLMVTKIIVFLS